MKKILVLLLLLIATRAIGQEITLNGIARTVSLMTAISGCDRYYPIDAPLVEKAIRATKGVGEEVAAKESKHWPTILLAELKRRLDEVDATGQKMWCSYQRKIPQNRQFFRKAEP
jgi:hypothetical protein